MDKAENSYDLTYMARPFQKKKHLIEKYYELAWALSLQDYNYADIGVILNRHRSVIKRAIGKMPKGYEPKWAKVQ